jgi:hypothetical protein
MKLDSYSYLRNGCGCAIGKLLHMGGLRDMRLLYSTFNTQAIEFLLIRYEHHSNTKGWAVTLQDINDHLEKDGWPIRLNEKNEWIEVPNVLLNKKANQRELIHA